MSTPVRKRAKRIRSTRQLPRWSAGSLEDAKARFNEVMRPSRTRGPQLMSNSGKQAAFILPRWI